MRSQTMTTPIASPPAGPPETTSPTNYTLVQENTISNTCIISRLSKWLWSNQTCASPETSAKAVTSTDVETRSSNSEPCESAFPCRGCQAWGVECDRQKPHCSHCLDQQILCFYVEPLRITMKRSKQSKMAPAVRSEIAS
ncbi:hypothetical protein BJY04DRAFT_38475 [Aspergillus karnatakaensis]|uniref:uncharacterized protein n=1 Tax=Aspergillus karnatakaensis TaxID=1810916 RepID=UPI003CCE154E